MTQVLGDTQAGERRRRNDGTGNGQRQALGNRMPSALTAANKKATELVNESSLTPEEREKIWKFRAKPEMDASTQRHADLDRSMQAQGMRFWKGREDEGILVVPRAGELLHRLRQ